MTICNDCGGTIIEYDAAAGNGFCVKCGTVVEENTIVSEVTFGETSSGAAVVQGSYVAPGSTHTRMSGPFGNRGGNDSREQTIANANRRIQNIAAVLQLSDVVCLAATRLYTLAVEHKFTKGRKSLHVVAVCLYVACRQKETRNYMLIDFSDLLQVNVFELGHTYLQLVHTLNLRLPLVDPSHYISRFSALLEFGDDTHKVAHDAVRLVQRFDRDWMTKGRRPAGICGAALLLAARMNNFRRSIEEVVQVVKIADTTLKKRLEEFSRTSSAGLTVVDFRRVWLEEEMDPPAFTKGKEKEEAYSEEEEGKGSKKKGKGNKKRKRVKLQQADGQPDEQPPIPGPSTRPTVDPLLFNQGILAGTLESAPLDVLDEFDDITDKNIDPILLPSASSLSNPPSTVPLISQSTTLFDETAGEILSEEVSTFLQNPQGAQLSQALAEAEERRLVKIQLNVVDELTGLDEEELDRMILTEEEVKVKERVWVEMNKDYLEAIAVKAEREATGNVPTKIRKRRKANNRAQDAAPLAMSAAESVRNLIKKNPKYSKRINYDALKELFIEGSSFATSAIVNEKTESKLYIMDEKIETEEMVVIDEEGGRVGVGEEMGMVKDNSILPLVDEDAEGEDDIEGSDKGDDMGFGGWEDVYEQEV